MTRKYVQVTPSRSDLAPGTVVEQLGALHGLDAGSDGVLSALTPFDDGGPPTFEFLALSAGVDEPVEFYYGADDRLDVIEDRIRTLYPSTFVIEHTELDLTDKLVPTGETGSNQDDGALLDEFDPVGVTWYGDAARPRDWMTTLPSFSATVGDERDHSRAPLAPLIEQLAKATHPLVFQVLFRRKADWTPEARERERRLREGEDRLLDRIAGEIFVESPHERQGSAAAPQQEFLDPGGKERAESIEKKRPKHTFTVNLRVVSLAPSDYDQEELDRRLETLVPVFDHLSGTHYGVTGKRLQHGLAQSRTARKEFTRLRERSINVGRWGPTRPDLVLNPDELANFVVIPPSTQLTTEGGRGTEANPESRPSLPRPKAEHMEEFREGMAIGCALDENSEPEPEPTHVPPRLLPTHYLRAATTGAGKSKALVNDALSLHEDTEGPIVLIDPKGDGLTENYMRAHASRFGFEDLEANIVHFPVPDVLPGFAFFNIEPDLEAGRPRVDAVQNKAEHYEEILKLVMGEKRYEQAIVAPNLIKYLIKALYDEEFGLENGLYRESVDYFAHMQLEHVLDQLWQAGPPNGDIDAAPQSSQHEVQRKINRQLELDSNTFATVMGGVSNRLDYVTQDAYLRRIFDNTEPRFDFRDVLNENTVVLFDLGDLRDEAARLMTGVILTELEDALETRKRAASSLPDNYVVNLLIDEAASVAVSEVMNNLLEKGRSFRLSVGLSLQFPEQIEEEGDQQVYLNILNDIATTLVGKISVDREIARAMAHEEMDPTEFANRIRSLPRGEWIAQLPSPQFGETGPDPFSVEPLPIPDGHPESSNPFDDKQESAFQDALDRVHGHTAEQYGVPSDGELPTERTPEAVRELLGSRGRDLDQVLASVIRIVQMRVGVAEENGWVPVEDVDAELRACYDAADVDDDPPGYGTLADIRKRSRLIDVDLDSQAENVVVRLTEAGAETVSIATGDVRAAGGDRHDDLLGQIEEAMTPLAFTVAVQEQDGSEQPDATAFHPDFDVEFNIEVETTTPDKPAKVLANLRRAQEAEMVPLFVVETGVEAPTYWANRLENILCPPVKRRTDGEVHYYTTDEALTFNGGARTAGGVTAVRPTGDGSHRSVWVHDDEEFVLRDGEGTESARIQTIESPPKDRFPAIYSYDPEAEEYTVYERGETHVYESREGFEDDWVRVRRPFVPEVELPVPWFDQDTYAIVIVPGPQDEIEKPVVYEDSETDPLSSLVDEPPILATESGFEKSDVAETPSNRNDFEDDPDAAIEVFVSARLVQDEGSTVTTGDVYDAYMEWAEARNVPVESKNWFARRLGDHIAFERTSKYRDGETVRCYEGIALTEENQ